MKKAAYIITCVNLIFQIVYSVFGRFTTTELKAFVYIFAVFRAEYMIISGLIAFINIFILAFVLTKDKKGTVCNLIMILLNVEFILYYVGLISRQ